MKARPTVTCRDCGSDWHGSIAAHGLSVLGHCPRCGGHLRFRAPVPQPDRTHAEEAAGSENRPWLVLGRPGRF
jgi:hypothetical protein